MQIKADHSTRQQQWLIFGAILILTLAVFLPSLNHGFVNWDDPTAVQENPLIQQGLSMEMVKTAFSGYTLALYYPVTQLSYALDVSLFGMDPGAFHRTNLFIHLLNVLLVFLILKRLFDRQDLVAFATLLFAIHPCQVEPVVWISSRKDVLFLFFMLLGWWFYLTYIKGERSKKAYLVLVAVCMLLSLMSKVTAMVFPVVLVLTDFLNEGKDWRKYLLEKLPFLALSLLFIFIGTWGQQAGGAIAESGTGATSEGFVYGFYALIQYLIRAVFPLNLAAFHPYPAQPGEGIPWYVFASMPVVLLLVFLAYRFGRKQREFAFGILLFFLPMLPFLQFLPIGQALTAERYTYFPYIGLFIALFFLGEWLISKANIKVPKQQLQYAGIGLIAALCLWLGRGQVQSWKDGESLWTQVIKVHPRLPWLISTGLNGL
ncbi:MAG: hypothetical protein R3B47_00770 [Bacteroidia bacterium]